MRFKLPHSLKLCIGTCLAALLLGLQNIDEYTQQLESHFPQYAEEAEKLSELAYRTRIPEFFHRQKEFFSDLGNSITHFGEKEEPPAPPEVRYVYIQVPTHKQLDVLRTAAPAAEESMTLPETVTIPEDWSIADVLLPTEPTEQSATQEPEPEPEPTPEPEPEPKPLTPEQIREQNLANPVHYRVMMMGDSLMEDLGPRTHRHMQNRKGLHFILSAKYSTGLSRPDYFNWPEHLEAAIAETKPDLVVYFIGANDGMPIVVNGQNVHPIDSERWKAAYKEKMKEVVEIARKNGCEVIWIGIPPIGGRYANILAQTALSQKEGCSELNIPFLETTYLLGDSDGSFRSYMTDAQGNMIRLRRKDQTHLSPEGNMLVLDSLMPLLEEKIADFRQKHPEKTLSEEEAARFRRAQLEVTIKYVPKKRKRR